jgi:hypothetical protein
MVLYDVIANIDNGDRGWKSPCCFEGPPNIDLKFHYARYAGCSGLQDVTHARLYYLLTQAVCVGIGAMANCSAGHSEAGALKQPFSTQSRTTAHIART